MTISKRTRFEIFKRDCFRCIYCGSTPNDKVLRVDHVEPRAAGGSDDPSNLVTACFDCNAGKSDVALGAKKLAPRMTAEHAKDHAEQILGYLDAQRSLLNAQEEVFNELLGAWETGISEFRDGSRGSTPQERGLLKSHCKQYPLTELIAAVEIAVSRTPSAYNAFKYYCGIIRRWRETGSVTAELPPEREPRH